MRFTRDLRLIPVVAVAASALFVLKTAAIVVDGGYTLMSSRAAFAQGLGEGPMAGTAPSLPPPAALEDAAPAPRGDRAKSWIRDINGAPEYTGSVAPKPDPAGASAGASGTRMAEAAGAAPPAPAPAPADMPRAVMTPGERAVLESLQQRRQELEARAREIEVRDSLLKAAEKRIEQRLQELKDLEGRLTGASAKKDEAETAKFRSLVSMYENMKAKDAAKIFDRLNMRILVEVVNAMNPRRMADILGLMQTEAAERLTVEIANRSGAIDKAPAVPVELPKIEGQPNKS